ncbi:hypothetical protein E2C01_004642 [Portunus trituberculatus]|uniref:Secreted protein n=1 Tax=Portunus trituberculatus TaxID=210409 RepID=A0A5B7CRW7_PORTR|nr:hypothetical protein [Portunus trituberculatus]
MVLVVVVVVVTVLEVSNGHTAAATSSGSTVGRCPETGEEVVMFLETLSDPKILGHPQFQGSLKWAEFVLLLVK